MFVPSLHLNADLKPREIVKAGEVWASYEMVIENLAGLGVAGGLLESLGDSVDG